MRFIPRVNRLLKADFNNLIALFENKSHLLSFHLQEMRQGLLEKDEQRRSITQMSRTIQADLSKRETICGHLEREIAAALKKNQESIARGLIREQLNHRRRCTNLQQRLAAIEEELNELTALLNYRRSRYEMMKAKVAEYEIQRSKHAAPEGSVHDAHDERTQEAEIELELLRHRDQR